MTTKNKDNINKFCMNQKHFLGDKKYEKALNMEEYPETLVEG